MSKSAFSMRAQILLMWRDQPPFTMCIAPVNISHTWLIPGAYFLPAKKAGIELPEICRDPAEQYAPFMLPGRICLYFKAYALLLVAVLAFSAVTLKDWSLGIDCFLSLKVAGLLAFTYGLLPAMLFAFLSPPCFRAQIAQANDNELNWVLGAVWEKCGGSASLFLAIIKRVFWVPSRDNPVLWAPPPTRQVVFARSAMISMFWSNAAGRLSFRGTTVLCILWSSPAWTSYLGIVIAGISFRDSMNGLQFVLLGVGWALITLCMVNRELDLCPLDFSLSSDQSSIVPPVFAVKRRDYEAMRRAVINETEKIGYASKLSVFVIGTLTAIYIMIGSLAAGSQTSCCPPV